MSITVLFFAYLRELVGSRVQAQELPERATVDDLWSALTQKYPALAVHRPSVVCSVNQEYATGSVVLHQGDEVALLPPVSGGADEPACWITTDAIDTMAVVRQATRESDGGVVIFEGVVRNNSDGRSTSYLEYEAYPAMAIPKMEVIARDAAQRWPESRLVIVHRIGRLEIGDVSVVVVAVSPHRGDAFRACEFGIDTLKQSVPIWKKEFYTDGAVWKEGATLQGALQMPATAPE